MGLTRKFPSFCRPVMQYSKVLIKNEKTKGLVRNDRSFQIFYT